MKLLLVGEESKNRRLVKCGLSAPDWELSTATTSNAVERSLATGGYEAVLLDWQIGAQRRSELLAAIRRVAPVLPIVAMGTQENEIGEASVSGVAECVLNSATTAELHEICRRAAGVAPTPSARGDGVLDEAEHMFRSASPLMRRVFEAAWKAARTTASVMIIGENGTGKSVLARAIHGRSERREKAFVTVNCPCLQARLVESELFGHVRGAFTGAVNDAGGKVAAAEGGTLFLDEVGELPLEIQPKLLRLLQEREYERLGESKTRAADIRVIAATNRDLRAEVAAGRFREDLYYRLTVIPIEVLPLRHRPEDILPTADNLLHGVSRVAGRPLSGFTEGARELLQTHQWPGNLRELRNVIERAAILSEAPWLQAEDFGEIANQRREIKPRLGDFVSLSVFGDEHISGVIATTSNYQEAACILGVNTSTLYRWRKRAEANVAEFEPEPVAARAG